MQALSRQKATAQIRLSPASDNGFSLIFQALTACTRGQVPGPVANQRRITGLYILLHMQKIG